MGRMERLNWEMELCPGLAILCWMIANPSSFCRMDGWNLAKKESMRGRKIVMYRDLEHIPVLAKAGGIVSFTREISAFQAVKNPDSLWIRVYAGADGCFILYEDDNETCDYERNVCVKTRMTYAERERAVFTAEPARGDDTLIPTKREYG